MTGHRRRERNWQDRSYENNALYVDRKYCDWSLNSKKQRLKVKNYIHWVEI